MPTYNFIDTETDEEFEVVMKIAEREEFLKENPQVQPIITAPALISGVGTQQKIPEGCMNDTLLYDLGNRPASFDFVTCMATAVGLGLRHVRFVYGKWKPKNVHNIYQAKVSWIPGTRSSLQSWLARPPPPPEL
jgi:hypothetical protein